ncbi:MAG: hypothetical protein SFZ23_07320 [Planctomycetota bacterium]|nr:hypothetical protein [Planctomycetota bacterium]
MNPHEMQYVDSLVNLATERFVERLVHHHGGAHAARGAFAAGQQGRASAAREAPLTRFVHAFFADAMLDNPAGACAVLQALADRAPPAAAVASTIGGSLVLAAQAAFGELVAFKAEEALDRACVFEGAR